MDLTRVRGMLWSWTMLLRAFLIWLVLMAAEIMHGTLRTLLLVPRVGDRRARQLSVFTGSVLVFLLTCLFIPWVGARGWPGLMAVGGFWVVLTLIFEIGFGRLVLRYSWERVLSDFDPRRGGLLLLGMAAMLLSPPMASYLRAWLGR